MKKNTDKIVIKKAEFKAKVGILPKERHVSQPILISAEILTSFQDVLDSDSIDHTVDYTWVLAVMQRVINQKHYDLLETLAEKISDEILKHPLIFSLRLSILKTEVISWVKGVGVEIYREKRNA